MQTLEQRCEAALKRCQESQTARAWRRLLTAAAGNEPEATVAALRLLPDQERFVATMLIGLSFRDLQVATAFALDDSMASGYRAVDWSRICDERIVTRWAIAAREIDPATVARIVNRGHTGIAGRVLVATIREWLRAGDIAGAQALWNAINDYAKAECAAGAALIWLATSDEVWSWRAVSACTGSSIIQAGWEEADGLATVLAEYQRAGQAADSQGVTEVIAALKDWVDDLDRGYDSRDAVRQAGFTCVRAGWLDHARTMASFLYNGDGDELDEAIKTGVAPPPRTYEHNNPTLDEVLGEERCEDRLEQATSYAEGRYAAGEPAGALKALGLVLGGGDELPAAPTAAERAAWALALAVGGGHDEAREIIVDLARSQAAGREELPRDACEAAVVLAEQDVDVSEFVDAATAHATQLYSGGGLRKSAAAGYLAGLIARENNLDRELTLFRSVNFGYADRAPWPSELAPIRSALRVLSDAHPERLDQWLNEIDPPVRPFVAGAAVRSLAELPLAEIIVECRGGQQTGERSQSAHDHELPQEFDVEPLAVALADRGRVGDALELVRPYRSQVANEVLLKMAEYTVTPDDRERIKADFRARMIADKATALPSGWDWEEGEEAEHDALAECRFGALLINCGQIDDALTLAESLPDIRYQMRAPELVRRIGERLDAADSWTPERAAAVVRILAGPSTQPNEADAAILATIPGAVIADPELSLVPIEDRLRHYRWRQVLVRCAAAVGAIRAGRVDDGVAQIARELDRLNQRADPDVLPQRLLWCVQQIPRSVGRRNELFIKVFRMLTWAEPARQRTRVEKIFSTLDPADALIMARAIRETQLPDKVRVDADHRIAEFLAEHSDTGTWAWAGALPIDSATTPATARERTQQAARFEARRGALISASRLAKRAGLATLSHHEREAIAGLEERCEQMLERCHEGKLVRVWRALGAAAADGDGQAAAAQLIALPQSERFVAALVQSLTFPRVLVALAAALDDSLLDSDVADDGDFPKALRWNMICDARLLIRWGLAAREVDAARGARIVNRADPVAAGRVLLEMARDRAQINAIADATIFAEAIDGQAKISRAAACALLRVATRDDEWSRRAIAGIVETPMSGDGSEEADALATVLGEYQRAGLAADAEAVVTTVTALVDWGDDPDRRYLAERGYYWGTQHCVRAGWLDHARALAACRAKEPDDPLYAAITTGIAVEPPQPAPLAVIGIDRVTAETDPQERLVKASRYAEVDFAAGELMGGLGLAAVLDDADTVPEVADPQRQAEWALALAVGGAHDAALKIVVELAEGQELPLTACQAALRIAETDYDATAFVDAAIAHGHATASYNTNYPPSDYVATYLAGILALGNDLERQKRLLTAAQRYLTRDATPPDLRFAGPVRETLRILSQAEPSCLSWCLAEIQPRLRPYVAGAAVESLAAMPLPEIIAVRGGASAAALSQKSWRVRRQLQEVDIPPLATALAERGRLADALELLRPYRPRIAQPALLTLCETVTTAADRAEIIAAYRERKSSDLSRDVGDNWDGDEIDWNVWLARMLLLDGQVDEAVAIAAAQPEPPHSYELGRLLCKIGEWLDATGGWTPARAETVMRILDGPGVPAKGMTWTLLALIPGAIAVTGDVTLLQPLFRKLDRPDRDAILDVTAALGDLRAGRVSAGMSKLAERVVDEGRETNRWVNPPLMLPCVTQIPRTIASRDDCLVKVFRILEWDLDYAPKHLRTMLDDVDPADLPVIAKALAESELPDDILAVGNRLLGALVVTNSDDASLLPIESAHGPVTARERVHEAACFLARHGDIDMATRLAAKAGLTA